MRHLIHTNHCKLMFLVKAYKSQSSQQNPHVMVASSRLPYQLHQHLCLICTNSRASVRSVNYTPTKLFNDGIPCIAEETRLPGTNSGVRTRVCQQRCTDLKCYQLKSYLGIPYFFLFFVFYIFFFSFSSLDLGFQYSLPPWK